MADSLSTQILRAIDACYRHDHKPARLDLQIDFVHQLGMEITPSNHQMVTTIDRHDTEHCEETGCRLMAAKVGDEFTIFGTPARVVAPPPPPIIAVYEEVACHHS